MVTARALSYRAGGTIPATAYFNLDVYEKFLSFVDALMKCVKNVSFFSFFFKTISIKIRSLSVCPSVCLSHTFFLKMVTAIVTKFAREVGIVNTPPRPTCGGLYCSMVNLLGVSIHKKELCKHFLRYLLK